MAEYPDAIFSQREVENRPGRVFDANNKRFFYAEDLENLAAEIVAIQTLLGIQPDGDVFDFDPLFIDFLNGRVGIGTNSPTRVLHVKEDLASFVGALTLENALGNIGLRLVNSLGIADFNLIDVSGINHFRVNIGSSPPEFDVDSNGNMGTRGNFTAGSIDNLFGGVGVFSLPIATAPTEGAANALGIYAKDDLAGVAAPHVMLESDEEFPLALGDIKTKVLQIGVWDMDTDAVKSVAHGLVYSQIRSVSVFINKDFSSEHFQFVDDFAALGYSPLKWDSNNVVMERTDGGIWDNTSYNATSINRGFVVIQYQ
jgi:hypothetical protein